MNLSFLVLAVSVSSVASWTVFPLSGKIKEANPKYSGASSVVTSTTTSTASPSRVPTPVPQAKSSSTTSTSRLPIPQATSSFSKPPGIATPSKDLLPPKEDNRITSPVKPSLFNPSRIEPTPKAKVPLLITTKQPTVFSRPTTSTYKPLLSTNPIKRTVIEILTPKISTMFEPITTITNEDNTENNNNKTIMDDKEQSKIPTPVDTTKAKDGTSISNTNVESLSVQDNGSDIKNGNLSPITETTSQATTSATQEPITIPTTLTIATTSKQNMHSLPTEEASLPVSLGITTRDETTEKLLTRFNKDIENSSAKSTTFGVTSPSVSVSSVETRTILTTIASNVEQSSKDYPKITESPSTESSISSTAAFPSSSTTVNSPSSTESKVATASFTRNALLEAVEQPAIDLLPPKEPVGAAQAYSFFPFKPIYVELEPPKEEYSSVYYPSIA